MMTVQEDQIYIVTRKEVALGTVALRSDGLISWDLSPMVEEVTLEGAKEFMEAFIEVAEGKKRAGFVVAPHYVFVQREVHEFFANEELNKYMSANAFVVSSLALRLLVNFYIQFFKPARPTKLFNSKEAAIEWLKQFL